jgi:hypothetical protein
LPRRHQYKKALDSLFSIGLSSLKIKAFVPSKDFPGFGLELTGATGVFDPIRQFQPIS